MRFDAAMTRSASGLRFGIIFSWFAMMAACRPGGELRSLSLEYVLLDGAPQITQLLLVPGEQGAGQYLYALDTAQSSIHVVSASNHVVLARIALNESPLTMAVDETTATVYIALKSRPEIRLVDVKSHTLKWEVLTLPQPATSLAVGAGRRLYVGTATAPTNASNATASIQVFDLHLAAPTAQVMDGSGDGYVVGVSHDQRTLMTATYGDAEPMVTRWNIEDPDNPTVLDNAALFGGGVDPTTLPGTVVFARDDRTVYVLTRGSASYDGRLPVYLIGDSGLTGQRSLDIQYTPVAMVLNQSNTRMIVAHDDTAPNATVRDPPRHSLNDLHIFDGVTHDAIDDRDLPELPEYLADNGLVIDDRNTLYLVVGRGPETSLGIIRTER